MTIKQRLFGWIFKKELKQMEQERISRSKIDNNVLDTLKHIQEKSYKNPRNWIRHIVSLYGPFDVEAEFNVTAGDIIRSPYNDFEDIDSFLNELKSIADNKAYKALHQYLMAEQIVYIAKEGESETDNNYARATLNGFIKEEEAIARLMIEKNERGSTEEEFDTFAVMGE